MNNVSKLTVRAVRLGAGALALAGLLFVVYPALRPFSDETSLQGAAAFTSNAWVIAHTLGMIGFTLLPVGLLGLLQLFRGTPVEGLSYWSLIAALLGVGLTLPYYGGEAFGLQAIGQEAVTRHDPSLVGLADKVRGLPQAAMFTLGLLLIGVSAITVAVAVWRSGTLPKWSGVPFALAFALLSPNFSERSRFESPTDSWWRRDACGWQSSWPARIDNALTIWAPRACYRLIRHLPPVSSLAECKA